MIKPSFDIVPAESTREFLHQHLLLMEVGEHMFSYIFFDRQNKRLLAFKSYPVEKQPEKPMGEVVAEILALDELLQGKPEETVILYGYPESSLIPDAFFTTGVQKAATELAYGNVNRGAVLEEAVESWALHNVYRIPRETFGFLKQQFPQAKNRHVYSAWLSSFTSEEPALRLTFYPDHFIAAAIKDGQLQIMQSFSYQTPEDVVYFLLAICKETGLDPAQIPLLIQGLIDEQSSLFAEIRKYFLEIRLMPLPEHIDTGDLLNDYPLHYFTPILNLALCV